jgi:hypothetical protein
MSTERPRRKMYCCCSRADANRCKARAVCVLHGDTPEAEAYRAGMADAANGYPVVAARPIRAEAPR